MNAYFLGGPLNRKILPDPGSETYQHKIVLREKTAYRGGWTPEVTETNLYRRHPDHPVYKLKGYAPTEEDLLAINQWLGLARSEGGL